MQEQVKLKYEMPGVIDLVDPKSAVGVCNPTGSGASGANEGCVGGSATTGCLGGSDVVGNCANGGSPGFHCWSGTDAIECICWTGSGASTSGGSCQSGPGAS
ncbi:MAG: hypothetical protein HQ596_03145 [Candidatus Saganbacteria bacterium]|nr:hypothetical protein [Candidatus Saganbacteria bacterium]